MSIPLSRIIAKPLAYLSRSPVEEKLVSTKSVSQENGGFLIAFGVKSQSDPKKQYECKVFVDSDNISLSTQCKFHCTCSSFKFEFSSLLSKFDALIGKPDMIKLPKKANPVFICKHLLTCIRMLQKKGHVSSLR